MRRFVAFFVFGLWAGSLPCTFAAEPTRPNVLFIAIDDLRPELACYGRQHIQSPNMDRLAQEGVLFEHAYCMVPTCGASRASLMTGVRPSRQRFVTYLARADEDAPQALPLHTHFKNSGYRTVSLGKVFHHKTDHVDGWSEPPWRSAKSGYRDLEARSAAITEDRQQWPQKSRHRGAPFESFAAADDEYPDGDCATKAIRRLTDFAKPSDDSRPFFLAVGFLKPHLPFNAPKRYWDLYDREQIQLPSNYRIPTGVPPEAPHNSGELRSYAGIHPKLPVDHETATTLIHGYYACVSFVDAQVGRVLDALQETGLDKNTIVVLWGDHGWQLGEHGMWNKHSCFDTSLHTPLILRAPMDDDIAAGTRVRSLVEFIDIYPTLCDLCQLEIPEHVEGESALAVMREPSLPGKPFAISRYKRGDSIHDGRYRYSEYSDKTGAVTGAMMFDHRTDPSEDKNVVSEKSETANGLATALHDRMGKD